MHKHTLVPLVQVVLAEHGPVGALEHLAHRVHESLAVLVEDERLGRDRERRHKHHQQRPHDENVLHLHVRGSPSLQNEFGEISST